MEKVEMVKFEATVAFEDETFEEVLERLGVAMPDVYVRVLQLNSPSGGWPSIEVAMPVTQIAEFAEWYCEDDAAIWEEAFRDEAVEL
jgi:hypothetical protein